MTVKRENVVWCMTFKDKCMTPKEDGVYCESVICEIL